MTGIKDWRGTPIEVGKVVLTHSKNWGYGLGIVSKMTDKTVTVALTEHNYRPKDKQTLVTIPHSVTVLTEDLLELIPR